MSSNKSIDLDIMNISDKDYLSYITKKNKIHDEIRDSVINRFIKIIYRQNNEILQLKKKLEDTIKKSLLIIRKNIVKKILSPVNQINLSFIKNTKKINKEQKGESINLYVKNMLNIESTKDNSTKSIANLNRLNIKKKAKKKIPSIDNRINNNNNLLNYINITQAYRNHSRNYFKKNLTYISDNRLAIDKKNIVEPISINSKKKYLNFNLDNKSEDKGMTINESKNKIIPQHSFFFDNNQNSIRCLTIQTHKNKNKIKMINNKLKNFRKVNLSLNNNNNMYDYCPTERTNKNKEKIKYIFSLKKNIFNSLNPKNTNKNRKCICKNSFTYNKVNKTIKINKFIMKVKELNKNIISTNYQKVSQKTENKINMNDMNRINPINYIPKTDRISENKTAPKKIIYNIDEQRKEKSININENINSNNLNKDNTLQTVYNPTFTSFLDRK